MVSYPHTHIFHGEQRTVAIAGPHIQVLDSKYAPGTFICRPFLELNFRSGELLHSTASFEEPRLDEVLKAGPVRCAAVDSRYTHLATTGDDKLLKVWTIDTLQLLNERYATFSPRTSSLDSIKPTESSRRSRHR